MRLKRDAAECLVFLVRRHAGFGVDERREVVIHQELVHQHDIASGKARMIEQTQLRQRPVNCIVAFGIERDFAIVIRLDAMRLPSDFRIRVTSVVELKSALCL